MRIFLAFGFAVVIGLLLLFSRSAPTVVIDDAPDLSLPAFAGCAADADCRPVDLPCGKTGAARQSQHRYVQGYYNDLMPRIRCPMPDVPARAPHRAACIDNICTALPATAKAAEPPHAP